VGSYCEPLCRRCYGARGAGCGVAPTIRRTDASVKLNPCRRICGQPQVTRPLVPSASQVHRQEETRGWSPDVQKRHATPARTGQTARMPS
jgi:hypothetical protein